MGTPEQDELWVTLNGQTAKLGWAELQKHFARGVVITVSTKLDLVDVAMRFARDDRAAVDQWLKSGEVARASSQDAERWERADTTFWAVVIAPWVLVQEIQPQHN